MKNHPTIGYNVLRRIKFLESAVTDRPAPSRSLQRQRLSRRPGREGHSLGARIFNIADAIDAMTSDRPYQKALSFENAAEELQHFSGKRFDPEIISIFNETGLDFWIEEKSKIEERIKIEPDFI